VGSAGRTSDGAPSDELGRQHHLDRRRSYNGSRRAASDAGCEKTLEFLDFVARDLIPKLREHDVVVLDNLRQQRDPSVRLMIENAGARVIYLPPYSPELNPSEPYWSAFKKHLRRLEARTVDTLLAAIDLVRRRRISTRRVFAHCGYV
jgi:transposase